MPSASFSPSGLHLKKELTALKKAKCLRDPETSSTWRSPLSSRRVAITPKYNFGSSTQGNRDGTNKPPDLVTPEYLPNKGKSRRKKVFLYNWRQQSGKSSDSGAKIDQENRPGSVSESAGGSLSDANIGDSKSDVFRDDPTLIFRVREANFEIPRNRMISNLKQTSVLEQQIARASKTLKLLDVPSNSVKNSKYIDLCNSEEMPLPSETFTGKLWISSLSASPLLSYYENCSNSSKNFKDYYKENSSCSQTPPSSSSYNRHRSWLPGTTESCDGATASLDGNELDQLDLAGSQGCGIPCYWLKRSRPSSGGRFSPSLSDRLRRRRCAILCGNNTSSCGKRKSPAAYKQKNYLHSTHSLPLLSNSCEGGESSVDSASDELSTNFGELELEASSRLDGRRWSTCRSQDGLNIPIRVEPDDVMVNRRSIVDKYRPLSFDELVGQSLIVQSLKSSILRRRIAPAYLFQGPCGTGKTSAARIFSAAFNCLSIEDTRPCRFCRECIDFASGKSTHVMEINAINKKRLDGIRCLLKTLSADPPLYRYKIFVIDECHRLPAETWPAFLKFLEKPPARVVFVFVTSDMDNLPPVVISSCQRYLFTKIKDVDIVTRLKWLVVQENLDADTDALDLIASSSDGSLRDAELLLDQLSLLDRKITKQLVNDLVGVVSDEKLLDLLELAMSSDTAETVKRARELLNSGIEPMTLMSQLASLIMDIIAGTYHLVESKINGASYGGRRLTETELEKLKLALKVLSQAEKQLQHSTERSTWFTAALLQLGSQSSADTTHASSKRRQAREDTEASSQSRSDSDLGWRRSRSNSRPMTPNGHISPSGDQSSGRSTMDLSCDALDKNLSCMSQDKLDETWRRCIKKCHSKALRQLLGSQGKLVSVLEVDGVLIAYIAFWNKDSKCRAERFFSSITNSVEAVLRRRVEVRIELISDGMNSIKNIRPFKYKDESSQRVASSIESNQRAEKNEIIKLSEQEPQKKVIRPSREIFENSCHGSQAPEKRLEHFLKENKDTIRVQEEVQDNSAPKIHGAINEESLKGNCFPPDDQETPVSMSRFKAERNHVLPQGDRFKAERNQVFPQRGTYNQNQKHIERMAPLIASASQKDDEVQNEIKSVNTSNNSIHHKEQSHPGADHCPISPSLLHTGSFGATLDKGNLGYESASGCYGILCWKTSKPPAGRVKLGACERLQRSAQFSLFGQCGKHKNKRRGRKF